MSYDNESPPGSWREEMIKQGATPTQLREFIGELEHLLKASKRECERLKEQNSQLIKQMTEAVALQMEAQGQVTRLKEETKKLWAAIKLA